ncbi:MAG: GNAT family N-acetyltransferase [Ramlibacter sp.]
MTKFALLTGSAGKTVTVVDLSSHDSEAAWLLRSRLLRVSGLMRGGGMGLSHLLCPQVFGRAASQKSSMPEGFWLRWDASIPQEAPILEPTGQPWHPQGPLVVVVGDAWKHLRQQVAAVHYGKVFEWSGAHGSAEWERRDAREFPSAAPGSMLPYLEGANSFVFSLPVGALAALRGISRWAPRGFLVVARGEGWADEKALREADAAMINAQRLRSNDLPINFHWMAAQCAGEHALSIQIKTAGHDVVQLVMGGHGASADHLADIGQTVESASVADATQLTRGVRLSSQAGDVQMALALLRQSGWDAGVFSNSASMLAEALSRSKEFDRLEWSGALRRIWDNRLDPRRNLEFPRGIARAALACGDVALAQDASEILMRAQPQPDDRLIHAECLEQTGQAVEALAACEEALAGGAQLGAGLALRTRLRSRLTRRCAPWLQTYGRKGSALMLEPLDAHHAQALYHQYRDPQISVMTGLPPLASMVDAEIWIDEKVAGESATYAVVHREFGFVGCCELSLNEHGAFLCFWIGTCFQGKRFASQVASMVSELAFRNGVPVIWSSVFDDNTRSLRALRASGFTPVGIRALAPHDERTFLHLAPSPMETEEALRGLASYCRRANPAIKFGEIGPTKACPEAVTAEGGELR